MEISVLRALHSCTIPILGRYWVAKRESLFSPWCAYPSPSACYSTRLRAKFVTLYHIISYRYIMSIYHMISYRYIILYHIMCSWHMLLVYISLSCFFCDIDMLIISYHISYDISLFITWHRPLIIVETQLRKLLDTSDRLLGALVLCSVCNTCVVFVNYIYDMVVGTQFHKFHGRPFARVLYAFLMKDIGRWLPWVQPGSTGRFYKDHVVHNHSAHEYYITLIEGGVRWKDTIAVAKTSDSW